MDTAYLLIGLSLAVLVSYSFDLFSSRLKTPSVILLLLLGIITRWVSGYFDVQIAFVAPALSALGTLGLILVVLEGALDLELPPEKFSLVRRTAFMAFSTIALTNLLIASVMYLLIEETFYRCLLNSLPFAIISNARAALNSNVLDNEQRDFFTYETAFSSIIGVTGFNFLISAHGSVWGASFSFLRDTVVMAVVAVICCFGLLFLIGRINHPVKFLPIISVLLLVYGIAEVNHFSSLLLILVFGLFLNNTELFVRGRLDQILKNDLFEKEFDQLKNLTAEGSFVVRTFFFLLFGYAADIRVLADIDAWVVGGLFVAAIVGVRYLTLRVAFRGALNPLVYIAPRGLVTILLYLNIPKTLTINGFPEGVLLVTVILSASVTMAGVIGFRRSS
jgi:potassium/hydrogen antiporter